MRAGLGWVVLACTTAVALASCDEGATDTFLVSDRLPSCVPDTTPDCASSPRAALLDALTAPDLDPGSLSGEAAGHVDPALLSELTGVGWSARRTPADDPYLLLNDGPRAERPPGSVFILESVRTEGPERRILAFGSADGATVWVNGERVHETRYALRSLLPDGDAIAVDLRAGTNVLLYEIHDDGTERQAFYRRLRDGADAVDAARRAVEAGAFLDLSANRIIPDTAAWVGIKRPRIRGVGDLDVTFRWLTLEGEPMEAPDLAGDPWPESMPLPAAWTDGGLLRVEVVEPGTGHTLYGEEASIFTRSGWLRLARELVEEASGAAPGDSGTADPVLSARVALAERLVAEGDGDGDVNRDWLRASATVDLYRALRLPDRFHAFPGPQVWAYRDPSDGSVQPFWVVVPDAPGSGPDRVARPVGFLVTHARDPDYWNGRGGSAGFVLGAVQLATLTGSIVVYPHFRGAADFHEVGREELPAVIAAIDGRLPVDRDRIGLLVSSGHARSALALAAEPTVPLSRVGLVVPGLGGDLDAWRPVARRAAELKPGLEWMLWSGEDDEELAPEHVEGIDALLSDAGMSSEWRVIPHSNHRDGAFRDPGLEFLRSLAGPGGEGR